MGGGAKNNLKNESNVLKSLDTYMDSDKRSILQWYYHFISIYINEKVKNVLLNYLYSFSVIKVMHSIKIVIHIIV